MSKSYFDKNGQLQYVVSDDVEKCFSSNEVCQKQRRVGTSDEKSGADIATAYYVGGGMACRTNWWNTGYWNNWWGWGYNWSVYGNNLTFLYSEIDAPEAYRCGNYYSYYNCFNFYGQNCEDMEASSCGQPRIARCKTFNCISDYNDSNYCTLINGKDREERCCKAPSNFVCKEGECDYDYEIVKKEYTVEYELVKPAYTCSEKLTYPEKSCSTYIPVYSQSCTTTRQECSTSPEAKCDNGYYWFYGTKCPSNPPPVPEGYELKTSTTTSVENLWELDECDCGKNESGYYTCPSCYKCEDLEDCNYDLRSWNNWYWGGYGYSGYIGDDCCMNNFWGYWWGWQGYYNQPCPIDGDGSDNPWWCDGEECTQKGPGEESENETGPYTSYRVCMEDCLKDETGSTNRCIPDSKTYTRGYCCDSNFIDTMQKTITEGCAEEGPQYTKTTEEKLCDATSCGTDLMYERSDDMCTYSTKYCPSHRIIKTFSNAVYGYNPPIQGKQYWRICNSCDKIGNDECEKDPNSKCPSNTEGINLIQNIKYVGEEVLETKAIKLIMVFCKITTKPCAPSTE